MILDQEMTIPAPPERVWRVRSHISSGAKRWPGVGRAVLPTRGLESAALGALDAVGAGPLAVVSATDSRVWRSPSCSRSSIPFRTLFTGGGPGLATG